MSREILFRGFHPCENVRNTITVNGKKIRGEWYEGYYVGGQYPTIATNDFDFDVTPETVSQYTGRTDKNGNKIFEGDRVYFSVFDYQGADTQYQGYVRFAEGHWQIWKEWEDEFYGADGAFDLWCICQQDDEIQIIGNIWEGDDDKS